MTYNIIYQTFKKIRTKQLYLQIQELFQAEVQATLIVQWGLIFQHGMPDTQKIIIITIIINKIVGSQKNLKRSQRVYTRALENDGYLLPAITNSSNCTKCNKPRNNFLSLTLSLSPKGGKELIALLIHAHTHAQVYIYISISHSIYFSLTAHSLSLSHTHSSSSTNRSLHNLSLSLSAGTRISYCFGNIYFTFDF